MKLQILTVVGLLSVFTAQPTFAQNACFEQPEGTVPACGEGEGYFRPQPYTLSSRGRIIENPDAYYAPIGKNQENWIQYYPSDNSYGEVEPNPFDKKSRLSPTRTVKHLWSTRVKPRLRRR